MAWTRIEQDGMHYCMYKCGYVPEYLRPSARIHTSPMSWLMT